VPRYNYWCSSCDELTEERRGYEDYLIPCSLCGGTAHRQAVYESQYTRTESGGMQGRMGRVDNLSEGQERVARNSEMIEKETGQKSGPRLR
jgi:hypothetical protein